MRGGRSGGQGSKRGELETRRHRCLEGAGGLQVEAGREELIALSGLGAADLGRMIKEGALTSVEVMAVLIGRARILGKGMVRPLLEDHRPAATSSCSEEVDHGQ